MKPVSASHVISVSRIRRLTCAVTNGVLLSLNSFAITSGLIEVFNDFWITDARCCIRNSSVILNSFLFHFLIKSDTLAGSQLLTNCVGEDRLVSESGESSNIKGIFVVYYLGYPAKIFFPLISTGGSFEVFLQEWIFSASHIE